MNYLVKINDVKSVDTLEDAWTNDDFKELLTRFDYADAQQLNDAELIDYLFMAISDFEPREAAAILLDYKLSDSLNEGQIDNISQDMLRVKVSENYTEINLHKDLFNINQLLYKAYNGKFQAVKANIVLFELHDEQDAPVELSKENALKALSHGLSDNNLMKRLLSDQLENRLPFPEAEGIVWDLKSTGNNAYAITISEKWLTKNDFENMDYACSVDAYEDPNEDA